MAAGERKYILLLADDDPEDRLLVRDALADGGCANCDLRFVGNGEELIDYLQRRGDFQGGDSAPTPDLILLDLDMPRKDGRDVLPYLKSHRSGSATPVVVLTTSRAKADVDFAYEMGVNSYVTKPSSYAALVDLMKTLCKYWFEHVTLPTRE